MSLCRVTWFCGCHNLEVITKAMREFYTYTRENSQKLYTEKHIPSLKNTWSSRWGSRCTTEKLCSAQTNTSCRIKGLSCFIEEKNTQKSGWGKKKINHLLVAVTCCCVTWMSGFPWLAQVAPQHRWEAWRANQDKYHNLTPIFRRGEEKLP